MFTKLRQWHCGWSKKSKYVSGHLRGPKETLVGARYRVKCTRCDKVLFEDTNLDKNFDRAEQKPKPYYPMG